MTCDQFAELLPAYCERRLSTREQAFAREHTEMCAQCRADADMWQKLASLPSQQPSAALRARFESMLNAYEEGRWERSSLAKERGRWFTAWIRSSFAPPLASALAACLLLAGFIAGEHFSAAKPNSQGEMVTMQAELTNLRQLVALSLLEQQSASQRLQGVNYSTLVQRPDPEIAAALLHALRFDNSVDVRLAALDALRRYKDDPQVRSGLLAALQDQQSPLVQIALIDLFVEMRESGAKDNLRRIEQDSKANPTVRQRAQWGIQQLS
ncbi:MAG: HEAT repeat domain-containing protein [Acidobacteria bacterium]|nr:HEAT repeat domain-containing protein [Acidobacteriota bacterium]MBV9144583.1 HEAT repeat domain-containing protein [Acidobacteriota bacterium]MBV9435029.1 HEAT repeat domain-containing protein [Acidobacteriota bacterium]